MKRVASGILAGMLAILVIGCIIQMRSGKTSEGCTRELFAMDTVMSFTAYGEQAEEAVTAAEQEIQRLDALLSSEKETSEISRLNAAGSLVVSEDTGDILREAEKIYTETDGLFDVTIYPMMQLWGFPDKQYHVPTEDEREETLSLVDGSKVCLTGNRVTLGKGQKVDLGGIAKGYASGLVMDIFRKHGITSAMVSLGGNVQTLGEKPDGSPWRVGIRDPEKEESGGEQKILLLAESREEAVVTSGGYERYFEQEGKTYIHILNPKTGLPVENNLISVTVFSKDGMLADALSTSLFVMGEDGAENFWKTSGEDFEMVLLKKDGSVSVTEGLKDRIRMADERKPDVIKK